MLQPLTWTPGHCPKPNKCKLVRRAFLAPRCSLPEGRTPAFREHLENSIAQAAHLDCCAVALQADDLPNELVIADTNQLIHRGASHVVCNDDRARHLPDIPAEGNRPEVSAMQTGVKQQTERLLYKRQGVRTRVVHVCCSRCKERYHLLAHWCRVAQAQEARDSPLGPLPGFKSLPHGCSSAAASSCAPIRKRTPALRATCLCLALQSLSARHRGCSVCAYCPSFVSCCAGARARLQGHAGDPSPTRLP